MSAQTSDKLESATNLVHFQIRIPKSNEFTPESTSSLFANFSHFPSPGFFQSLLGKSNLIISLEIVLLNNQIFFYVTCPTDKADFISSQILAQFPTAIVENSSDPLIDLPNPNTLSFSQITVGRSYYYPIKTSQDFRETDPLNSILAPISRSNNNTDFFLYQILVSSAGKNWQSGILSTVQNGILVDREKNFRQPHPDKRVFEQKIMYPGVSAQINLVSTNPGLISSVTSSFGIFTNPQGNYIRSTSVKSFSKNKYKQSVLRRISKNSLKNQILNTEELSVLWHFPNKLTKLPNIAWGKKLYSDPPENLPVADGATEEQKQQITFFAKTEFRNKQAIFGIKEGEDRRRHTYIIGKSGTGKTTMIANMAIDDIRKGKGVAVVDPHGDLCDSILNYIPSSRINDVCYFNPADPNYIYPLNILETKNESQKELVASGVISIFKKLYGNSWGPRLEHILRNTLLTLVNTPDTNLSHVVEILTSKSYRQKVTSQLNNQTLINFWKNEFDTMDAKFQNEAISPILNKVGQFLSSTMVRNTIAHNVSRIDIQKIMDEKKILIVDLSTGKLGEDTSALLGAMIITQIQLAAMNRAFQSADQRTDFYLYVDEFQNFATEAFIKILSEARKYKLNLILANQYMSQIDRTIQDAIMGNVGTIMSFIVGSQDAYILEREFGKDFPASDLVQLGRYQIICKMSIDSETQNPFYAYTLPPLSCSNLQKDKVIANSQQRWGKAK